MMAIRPQSHGSCISGTAEAVKPAGPIPWDADSREERHGHGGSRTLNLYDYESCVLTVKLRARPGFAVGARGVDVARPAGPLRLPPTVRLPFYVPPDDCHHRPPLHRPPLEGAIPALAPEPLHVERPVGVRVDDRHVGVRLLLQRPLAGPVQPDDPGGAGAHQV